MRTSRSADHETTTDGPAAAPTAPGKATLTGGHVVQRKPADGAAAPTGAPADGARAGQPSATAPATAPADDPYGMHLAGGARAQAAPDADAATPAADPKDGAAPKVKEEVSGELGFEIMKDAFSGLKADLSQGKVEVLEQAAFQVAYDKIYGAGDYSWEKYVKPKFGNLRGFAYEGTNYVNKDAPGLDVGTVVHEMLHNNVAADFSGVVGHQFEEGATEYLTVIAMKKAGKARASAYAGQLGCVTACVGAGLTEANLQTAYLVSGAQRLIADWFTGAMEASFTDFKTDMEAEDYAKAKAKIKAKAAGGSK